MLTAENLQLQSKKPVITIVQYYHGDNPVYPISERINRFYCKFNGYNYFVDHSEPWPNRCKEVSKLKSIDNSFNAFPETDYFLLVDADAWFYTLELTVEDILLSRFSYDKDVMMSQDITGEKYRWNPGNNPNSGVILYRNNERSKTFMNLWKEAFEVYPNLGNQWPPTQRALNMYVMPRYGQVLQIEKEYSLMNCYKGLFIRHLAGIKDEERLKEMTEFVESRKILWNEAGFEG